MIIAAPKTGVINASILIVKNKFIDKKGIKVFLCLRPGIESVRRVINKLVKDIVVLIPANITDITAISCIPKPVYFNFAEKGVIKVQPLTVRDAFGH
jgi:hypothetical protein